MFIHPEYLNLVYEITGQGQQDLEEPESGEQLRIRESEKQEFAKFHIVQNFAYSFDQMCSVRQKKYQGYKRYYYLQVCLKTIQNAWFPPEYFVPPKKWSMKKQRLYCRPKMQPHQIETALAWKGDVKARDAPESMKRYLKHHKINNGYKYIYYFLEKLGGHKTRLKYADYENLVDDFNAFQRKFN